MKQTFIIKVAKQFRSIFRFIFGYRDILWSRVIMDRETEKIVNALTPSKMKALEVSGSYWGRMPFKDYVTVEYPSFDLCQDTLDDKFDFIVAEQVFEHLLWPYRAGKNVYSMLEPGGHFLVTVPFMVQVHGAPIDCTRWTETGLKHFLAECGFPLEKIATGSWGNRQCIKSNYFEWKYYYSRLHTLKNEPDFPMHVWAIAKK